MPSLRFLDLTVNFLHGPVPGAFGESSPMFVLALSGNLLSGTIPSVLSQIPGLQLLTVNDNYLVGSIPSTFGALQAMIVLDVGGNFLTGFIPPQIGSLVLMQYLDLSDNCLTGKIPARITSMQQLIYLQIHDTLLRGPLPDRMGNMSALTFVYLYNNMLTSTVPASFQHLHNLTSLFLFGNEFSGSIDRFINSSTQHFLQVIQINANRFTGQLPGSLFALPQLRVLVLGDNCLTGSLPHAMCDASAAEMDGLHSGPSCTQKIWPGVLGAFVLTDRIENGIPDCLFQLDNLASLHLSGNGLTGTLPHSIQISRNLVDLVLSHNQLTGSIPEAFQERQWYNFDLSYNKLSATLSADSFATQALNSSVDSEIANQLGIPQNTSYFAYGPVSLRNNRLSSTVPSVLNGKLNLSVLLTGNLFDCALDQQDLPPHDSGRSTYSCGSNAFNTLYYMYLGLLFASAGLVLWRKYSLFGLRGAVDTIVLLATAAVSTGSTNCTTRTGSSMWLLCSMLSAMWLHVARCI